MSKNHQKEVISISFLNKNKTTENWSNKKDNSINKNNMLNIQKNKKKENLPKLIIKKDTNNNNDISNDMLNKKRERYQIHSKENEEEINNNIVNKKKMSLNEAKKDMKEFELLIKNTEKEIQNKYGVIFPDLFYEDNLPDEIKNKLIDNFLERPNVKKILNEANSKNEMKNI